MKWIENFDLFLFDFDGLLVNTEPLHYQAYRDALEKNGIRLDWSFAKFCSLAHFSALALKEALYAEHPHLPSNWDDLYQDKKKAYLQRVQQGNLELMPGAAKLLHALEKKNIRRCVVTHSPQEQIDLIRSQLAPLQTIPHWITRHQYNQPKPHPECYLKAIELYAAPEDRIIGFEDSIRGWQALKESGAKPIFICNPAHPLLPEALQQGALHYSSFDEMIGKLEKQ